MTSSNGSTWFAGLPRWQAVLVLMATLGMLVWCQYVAISTTVPPKPKKEGISDEEFYLHVVERVRAGENYYDVAEDEFKQAGYTLRSMFNWRTPLYAWIIGKVPNRKWAKAGLGAAALLMLGMAFVAVGRESGPVPAVASLGLVLIGPLALGFEQDHFLYAEVWAMIFVALSVCAYALDRWPLGVGAALFALFYRELTLPYCLICIGFAVWRRRWAELGFWLGGLVLFTLFMLWHRSQVLPRIPPSESGSGMDWVAFGGTWFVLSTCEISNKFLENISRLPDSVSWLTALYVPLGLLGLASWRSEFGLRCLLTTVAYLAAFFVVGHPYNAYWGLMVAPLLALGVVRAPLALRDLWQAIRRSGPASSTIASAE